MLPRPDTGAAHRQGHPNVLLVGGRLAHEQPVLAHVEAVVRRVDDVGVVQPAGGIERLDHGGDQIVDRAQGPQPLAIVAGDRLLLPLGEVGKLGPRRPACR